MPIDLKHLTPQQKVFGVALIGVTILALYVKAKNSSAKPKTSATSTYSPGTVNAGQDLSSLTSAFTSGLKSIQDSNTAIEQALATVISDSNKATVDALNAQSTTFGDALKTLGTGNQKAIKDLETASTQGFTGLKTYFDTQFGDLRTAGLKPISDSLATQLSAIQNLVQISDADRDVQYQQIGLQSSAACFNGSGYATTCVRSHLPDYVTGPWKGGDISDSDIQTYVKQNLAQKYPTCIQGGHFDLKCVGKQIVTQGYGV